MRRALDGALLLVAAAVVALTAAALYRGYSATLFADSWTVLMDYQAAGFRVWPGWLVGFHAEHRPLIARVSILFDLWWLGGQGWLPLGLIFVTQATHAWLLYRIAARQSWFRPGDRAAAASLAVFCCFYFSQIENFLWTFQTAFVLNFLFATMAAAGVAKQRERGDNRWAWLVGVSCSGAPLCLASGVFVWWIVAALAWALRLPGRWIAGYALAGCVTMALYLQGYARPALHNDPLDALRKPWDVIAYVLHYLGSSWRWWPLPVGEALAVAAMFLMGFRLIKLNRGKPWDAVPLAVMAFSSGTAILAALGRLNFGVGQAGASRYQTPAMLFWFVAGLEIWPLCNAWAFRLFVLLAMVWSFAGSSAWLQGVERDSKRMDIAGAAWLSGVADEEMLAPMTAGNQLDLYGPMRERRLGPFSVSPGSELGTILAPQRVKTGGCVGAFSQERSFAGRWPGVRFTGFARRTDGVAVRRFLAVSPDLRIAGVGVHGVVFSAAKAVTVYGVVEGGAVCPVKTN